MKNAISDLNFEGRPLTVIEKDGESWLLASEVCAILELRRPRDAVRRLDEGEYCLVPTPTPGGVQEVLAVTESGATHLTFVSRKPVAVRFRRWVTEIVLPRIRQTGTYTVGDEHNGVDLPALSPDQRDLLTRLSLPGPHMVFVMPGQEPYIEEVDPRQFIRDLDRHDVEGLIHAMNLIG